MGIDDRLQAVFRSVLGPKVPDLSEDDSPETLEGWDSANHLGLMMALEAEFEIEFEVDEIANLTRVGAIRDRLQAD